MDWKHRPPGESPGSPTGVLTDMKILVPVKRVVDYNVKIRIKSDGSGVELANVKMSMNPFDEIAVEEALRQKEAGKATEVIVVSVGPDPDLDVVIDHPLYRHEDLHGRDNSLLLGNSRRNP